MTEATRFLAPGGWFVAEGFSRTAIAAADFGPKAPDLLYDLSALRAALPEFRILEAFEGETRLEEGKRHQGVAKVVRLLAQKPLAD